MNWFLVFGMGSLLDDVFFWFRFWEVVYYLVFLVFCLIYVSLVFISW